MARKSNAAVEKELEEVAGVALENKSGQSRKEIAEGYVARFKKGLAPRTLQRRLEDLVVRGVLVIEGEGRRTRYLPKSAEVTTVPETDYVQLSGQGSRLRDLVRRPISTREKAGYDRDWLFSYVPGRTWYLPKAIRAKLHELGRTADENRPAGTFARDILGRLLIDLAWASSRLEGNTYTRLDTQNLIEFGQRAEGKDAQEAQMVLNHKAAIEQLVSGAESIGFNRNTILTMHALLSENLLGDPRDEGRLRERPVSITGTTYTPTAIPQVIEECFDRILASLATIPDPFERSFFAMVHIPYLQPFADVNKRTSRLAANIPLIADNLCPLSFVGVPEQAYVEGTIAVYEHKNVALLRDVYVDAYRRSCEQFRVIRESMGQPDPIRLRYRSELNSVVESVVRGLEPPRADVVRARMEGLRIADEDKEVFTDRALELLLNLHAGSAGRHQLKPGEFAQWEARYRQSG
jgi:hypothetical protein